MRPIHTRVEIYTFTNNFESSHKNLIWKCEDLQWKERAIKTIKVKKASYQETLGQTVCLVLVLNFLRRLQHEIFPLSI